MQSPEEGISNKTWDGGGGGGGGAGIDNPSGDKNQMPCIAFLMANTVWGPLPCMLSSCGGRGNPTTPGAAFNKVPSPLIVQPNDLWSLAAKTGQTGLNSKDPAHRYSESLGHIYNEHFFPWERRGRRCDLPDRKTGPSSMEHVSLLLPHPITNQYSGRLPSYESNQACTIYSFYS